MLRASFIAVLVLAACGDDVGDDIAPEDVTIGDLRGTWVRELPGGTRRVFAFVAAGAYHPALAEARDVMLTYDLDDKYQRPLVLATYEVDGGVLVQQTVWTTDSALPVELRNDIIGLQRQQKLTLRASDGSASEYRYAPRCELSEGGTGWRHHALQTSVYVPFSYEDLRRTSVGFAGDTLVAAMNELVLRFNGQCVPELAAPGGTNFVSADGQDAFAYLGFGSAETGPLVDAADPDAPLTLATRNLPDGVTFQTGQVIDGAFVMLGHDAGGPVLVIDRGAGDYTVVPIAGDGVPESFVPDEVVALDGGIAIVGAARTELGMPRVTIVSYDGGGFTSEATPFVGVQLDGARTHVAGDGETLWLVYGDGDMLKVARGRGETWRETLLGNGHTPRIVVQDGVGHIVHGLDAAVQLVYSRVSDEAEDQYLLPRTEGSFFDLAHGLPASIAVSDEGRVAIGFQGSVLTRDPDAESSATPLPLDIVIEGTGTVRSLDGSVSCTSAGEGETCSVLVDPGRHYLFVGEQPDNPEARARWTKCYEPLAGDLCPHSPFEIVQGSLPTTITAQFSGTGMRRVTPIGMQLVLGSAVARADGGWLMAGRADCQGCGINLPGLEQGFAGSPGDPYVGAIDADHRALFLRKIGNGLATEVAGKTFIVMTGGPSLTLDAVTVTSDTNQLVAFELDAAGIAVAGESLGPSSGEPKLLDAVRDRLVVVSSAGLYASRVTVGAGTPTTLPFAASRSARLSDRVALSGTAPQGMMLATVDGDGQVVTRALPSALVVPAIGRADSGLVALVDAGAADDLGVLAEPGELVIVHLDAALAPLGAAEALTLLAQPMAITERDGRLIAVAGASQQPFGLAFATIGEEPDIYLAEGPSMLVIDGAAQNRFLVFQNASLDYGVGPASIVGQHAELVWGP